VQPSAQESRQQKNLRELWIFYLQQLNTQTMPFKTFSAPC